MIREGEGCEGEKVGGKVKGRERERAEINVRSNKSAHIPV